MKHNDCFNCLNKGKGTPAENTGWYHSCNLGIANEIIQDVNTCDKYIPNAGFQIGGYYSHIHFEYPENEVDPCMTMFIHSDGEFPTDDNMIEFHICDFEQLENMVKIHGDYLRKKGVIK